MHKITFAQRGIAGRTHTALVRCDMLAEWMAYAIGRGHIIIVDKVL